MNRGRNGHLYYSVCGNRAFFQYVVSLLKKKAGKSILSKCLLVLRVPVGELWAICKFLLKVKRDTSCEDNRGFKVIAK